MKTIKIKTTGMHCESCEQLVQESISALPGVKKASANYKKAVVEVKFDEKNISPDYIKNAIKEAGYSPE